VPGVAEVLGQENEVSMGKIAWLSRRDWGLVYGSMVVYMTKRSNAARLLQDQQFHVAGESGRTGVFEPRYSANFRCQELGHKAFSCTKPQICGRCAQERHHHSECRAAIPKGVPCGGPHESFSIHVPHSSSKLLHPYRFKNSSTQSATFFI
jgi:hypothetical protein